MGVVYEAYDDSLGRGVAIKVLQRGRSTTGEARLKREAQALARVSHPNVVAVFGVGSYEGGLYLVMELVRGRPLSEWVAAEPRSADAILAKLVDAGHGLAAAHAAGIVHRDFKPENVLVGDDGRARVMDFGLARAGVVEIEHDPDAPPEGGDLMAPITRDGAVIGTPLYMSPEHFTGKNVGPASDQWSFCAAAWQLLFRSRPYEADDFESLARAVTEGEVRPPKTDLAPDVVRALVRGLSPHPDDRYASMEALLARLEPHVVGSVADDLAARRTRAAVAAVLFVVNLGSIGVLVGRPPPYFTHELLLRNPVFGAAGFAIAAVVFRKRLFGAARQRELVACMFLGWLGMTFHRWLMVRLGTPILDGLVIEAIGFASLLGLAGLVLDRSLLAGAGVAVLYLAYAAWDPVHAPLLFPVMLGVVLVIAVLAWGGLSEAATRRILGGSQSESTGGATGA